MTCVRACVCRIGYIRAAAVDFSGHKCRRHGTSKSRQQPLQLTILFGCTLRLLRPLRGFHKLCRNGKKCTVPIVSRRRCRLQVTTHCPYFQFNVEKKWADVRNCVGRLSVADGSIRFGGRWSRYDILNEFTYYKVSYWNYVLRCPALSYRKQGTLTSPNWRKENPFTSLLMMPSKRLCKKLEGVKYIWTRRFGLIHAHLLQRNFQCKHSNDQFDNEDHPRGGWLTTTDRIHAKVNKDCHISLEIMENESDIQNQIFARTKRDFLMATSGR